MAGILAIHINMGISGYVNSLLEMKLPLVLFAMPYAGPRVAHDCLDAAARARRSKCSPPAAMPTCAAAIRPFRAIQRLREAKVLYIRDGGPDPEVRAVDQGPFGTEIKDVRRPRNSLTLYQSIPEAEAAAHAERWIKGAEKVIEPPKDDIVKGRAWTWPCSSSSNASEPPRSRSIASAWA